MPRSLIQCFFAYLVNRWSDENAIKFAQRPFLYVILFGLALAYASVPLLLDTTPTRVSCATQLFLVRWAPPTTTALGQTKPTNTNRQRRPTPPPQVHGAFALVFTTIVAKMWRVMKISQVTSSLQKRAITNQVCESNGNLSNGTTEQCNNGQRMPTHCYTAATLPHCPTTN